MSIRTRIALVVGVIATVAVLAAGVSIAAFTARDLRARVDDELTTVATRFEGNAGRVLDRRPELAARLAEFVEGDVGVIVYTDGDPIEVGNTPDSPPALGAGAAPQTQVIDGQRWRVLRVDTAAGVDVQVVAPLTSTNRAVTALRNRVVLVTVVTGLGAALAGWLLGTWIARPIGRLRDDAADIADTADLERRITPSPGPGEVTELAATLNTMMERLESSAADTAAALDASRAFSSHASHELRTPLTSMQTDLDLLADHPDIDDTTRAQIVGELREQHARLLAMLDALRLLGRGELSSGEPWEAVDVADRVGRVVQSARRRSPATTFVEQVDPNGDFDLWAWPEGIDVLVGNLVANAVGHGAPTDGPAMVTVELTSSPDRIELIVSDNGAGVAPADRDRIFERFHRGTTTSPGTGLGLALVAQQVALHGGTVTVNDAPAGGARFTVSLPRRAHERS